MEPIIFLALFIFFLAIILPIWIGYSEATKPPKAEPELMVLIEIDTDQKVLDRKCHEYLTTNHW